MRRSRDARVVLDEHAAAVARAVARATAAGLPIGGAFAHAAESVDGPAAPLLADAADALLAGTSTAAALEALVGGPATATVVTAVLVHEELGGDLVRSLEAIAIGLDQRAAAAGELRALTAQARTSARIVPALPALALAALAVLDPTAIAALVLTPAGRAIASVSLILTVVAHLLMRRIVRAAAS